MSVMPSDRRVGKERAEEQESIPESDYARFWKCDNTAEPDLVPADVFHFESGAVRGTDADDTRYDLMSPIAIRRYAEVMAEGGKKYGLYNWEKGLPIHDLLNHGLKHIFQYLAGDRGEDHLGHALWNLAAACHSEEQWPALNSCTLRQEGGKPPEEGDG